MNILSTRPGWNAFERVLPAAASCRSQCARRSLKPKGQTMVNSQSKSGQAPKEMTERQNWIQDKFKVPGPRT